MALATWGLKLSIDFTGGAVSEIAFDIRPEKAQVEEILKGLDLGNTTITPSGDKEFIIKTNGLMGGATSEISFTTKPEDSAITEALKDLDLGNIAIAPSGDKNIIIKTKTINEETYQKIVSAITAKFSDAKGVKFNSLVLDEEKHQKMLSAITAKFSDAKEVKFDSIGSVIGKELRTKAVWAILTGILGIGLYVSWAFRKVSRPVSSWKYGVVSVVALFHDTIIPVGVFSYLGHYRGVEVDIAFIAAILTILGYSINDTIVVFDRTRENLIKHNVKDFEEVVNKSVNQTLIRSFNTTLTVIIVLFALYIFGAESLKHFALAMIIGVTVGAYSSVFIASPLLVEWQKRTAR